MTKRYIQKQKIQHYEQTSTHTNFALYFHIVWGTRNALPLITSEIEDPLKLCILKTGGNLDIDIIALEVAENHVHLLVSLKSSHYIPDIIKGLKGTSSHFVNHTLKTGNYFGWGRGYSIRSVSERNLNAAIEYIRNQKKKHKIT